MSQSTTSWLPDSWLPLSWLSEASWLPRIGLPEASWLPRIGLPEASWLPDVRQSLSWLSRMGLPEATSWLILPGKYLGSLGTSFNSSKDSQVETEMVLDQSKTSSSEMLKIINRLETADPTVKIGWLVILKELEWDVTNFQDFEVVKTGPRYLQFQTLPGQLILWLSSSPINKDIESILVFGV